MKLPLAKTEASHWPGLDHASRDEFERRWKQQFYDPAFEKAQSETDLLAGIAWEAYNDHRKSPRTRKAGPEFADPEHELAIEWLEKRAGKSGLLRKNKRSTDGDSTDPFVCASPRTDETVRVKCRRRFGSERCCANSSSKPADSRWIS